MIQLPLILWFRQRGEGAFLKTWKLERDEEINTGPMPINPMSLNFRPSSTKLYPWTRYYYGLYQVFFGI
ncbi:hypothetical protein M8J75_001085 [Diaphorina citri]|nr:hypothetical protein M8J75_001085 [Diaphorina citri]